MFDVSFVHVVAWQFIVLIIVIFDKITYPKDPKNPLMESTIG